MSTKSSVLTNPWFLLFASLGTGAGVYFGGKAIKKAVNKNREKNAGDQVDSKNPVKALAAQLAQRFRTAFNPSGYTWMMSVDTTSVDEVMRLGREMYTHKVPFNEVSSAYNNLYTGSSFVKDLQDELSSAELSKFYSILKTGLGSVALPPASTLIGI